MLWSGKFFGPTWVLRVPPDQKSWLRLNFLCVIQNDIIDICILQHFATKLWNITNFVMFFQAVMCVVEIKTLVIRQ
jgi:hypothetical protein